MEPEELTDELISKLCTYMRVIDLMKRNPQILTENDEMKQKFDMLCQNVNLVMERLTDKQRDQVLEIHKLQLEEIAKEKR